MIRVLICDDHRLVSEGIELMLQEEANIQVVGMVSSGKEAIHFLDQQDVDVLILDISMPDMDGLLVLDEINRQNIQAKVLILTMHEKVDYIKQAVKKGAKGYVLKSAESDKLIRAIQKVGSGATFFDDRLTEILMSDIAEEPEKSAGQRVHLTAREMDILKLLVKGKKTKKIAETSFISINTVLTHKKNIYSKLNIHSVSELINYAYEHKLID